MSLQSFSCDKFVPTDMNYDFFLRMNPKKRKLTHEELEYFANHIDEIDDINYSIAMTVYKIKILIYHLMSKVKKAQMKKDQAVKTKI